MSDLYRSTSELTPFSMSRWQDTFFRWLIMKTPKVIWRNWVNQRMELIITFVCSPPLRQLRTETRSPSVWFLGCLASFSQIPVDDILLPLFSYSVWKMSLILLSHLRHCSEFPLMSSSWERVRVTYDKCPEL